ncbi:MAG TPA: hypothetical protein VF174_11150 [Micromonosporaceae bacterium]
MPMESQTPITSLGQEAAAARRPVAKSTLGLGAAVLAGLAVATGVTAPAAAAHQPSHTVVFNIAEIMGSSSTCCPDEPNRRN